MKDGLPKRILSKTRIIPLYSKYQQFRYDRRVTKQNNPDRWYFKCLPIKKNKIVFDNFLGKGYGDNPKAISEEIIRQNLKWDLVWLTNKQEEMPSQIRQVKYGSPEAMRELATAKWWVFNCRNVMHPRKRKNQKYLQTWHSNHGFKLVEGAARHLNSKYIETAKCDGSITDYILSSCDEDSIKMRKFFS